MKRRRSVPAEHISAIILALTQPRILYDGVAVLGTDEVADTAQGECGKEEVPEFLRAVQCRAVPDNMRVDVRPFLSRVG